MGVDYCEGLLCVMCWLVVLTDSRTSTLWKLSPDESRIVEASPFHQSITGRDQAIFNIIASTVLEGKDEGWVKRNKEFYCTDCTSVYSKTDNFINNSSSNTADEILDCGKPVNFTYYDHLVGVLNRNGHPNVPEPQALLVFAKSRRGNKGELDVDALERRLKKAKREKPKSVQLYNQIGNFWRIKGDTQRAIECFRRALAVSPHNAEVLLNLARVLFTLQYFDDAIYLTRRSLEVQPPDKGAWQQYFTLGEIFKAYGHYQEATVHLRHALELKPGFEPAHAALREMESMPADTIHIYTLIIIICLVLGVLLVILSSVDTIAETEYQEVKTQRHFNKAMAMKTLRGLGVKNGRSKKAMP